MQITEFRMKILGILNCNNTSYYTAEKQIMHFIYEVMNSKKCESTFSNSALCFALFVIHLRLSIPTKYRFHIPLFGILRYFSIEVFTSLLYVATRDTSVKHSEV